METALVDLGSVSVVPTFARAMRGYIALSRVRKVDDLLLVQAFSPALFQQGTQPWASLLLDTMKGEVKWPKVEDFDLLKVHNGWELLVVAILAQGIP